MFFEILATKAAALPQQVRHTAAVQSLAEGAVCAPLITFGFLIDETNGRPHTGAATRKGHRTENLQRRSSKPHTQKKTESNRTPVQLQSHSSAGPFRAIELIFKAD